MIFVKTSKNYFIAHLMLEMDEQVITLLLEFGINPYLFFLLGYEAELQRLCVCFHNIFTQL